MDFLLLCKQQEHSIVNRLAPPTYICFLCPFLRAKGSNGDKSQIAHDQIKQCWTVLWNKHTFVRTYQGSALTMAYCSEEEANPWFKRMIWHYLHPEYTAVRNLNLVSGDRSPRLDSAYLSGRGFISLVFFISKSWSFSIFGIFTPF